MGPGGGPGGVVFSTSRGPSPGIFSFFFFRMRIGWILGSRPPEIELRTEAQSPSSVNCNECIPKKNESGGLGGSQVRARSCDPPNPPKRGVSKSVFDTYLTGTCSQVWVNYVHPVFLTRI